MDLSLIAMEDVSSPVKSITSEQVVFHGVDLQVVDYYYVAEGASYDKHFFIVEVFVEDIKYTVDRSYVDFVELDRRLRKVYPETSLPNLPLEGASTVEQALIKEASSLNDSKKVPLGSGQLSSTRNSVAYTRDSLISSPPFKPGSKRHHYQLLHIPDDSTEMIKKQKNPLTLYLVGLTCHHELLTSEAMTAFLDQEYTSMFSTVMPPPLSTFDLALLKVEVNHTIVSRIEEQIFKVPANHLVVWRFSLESFDIGFTVEVNGKIRLPLTRYRASFAPVCGAIEVQTQSVVSLRWNNSYARCKCSAVVFVMQIYIYFRQYTVRISLGLSEFYPDLITTLIKLKLWIVKKKSINFSCKGRRCDVQSFAMQKDLAVLFTVPLLRRNMQNWKRLSREVCNLS